MKVRAAVLEEFAPPLVVQELELADPGRGRGARAAGRLRRVSHRHVHGLRRRPVGVRADGARARGRGRGRGASARAWAALAPGDHVVTLFSPQCRECVHCLDPRTNLCLAIREQQNNGYLPDGTTRLSRAGEPIRHFMGTSTFAEYAVMPEIALAKVSPEASLERACLFACGLSTGLGAAMFTAQVQPGATCVVFGAGMVGLGAVAGCRLRARRADHLRRPVAGRGWSSLAARARPTAGAPTGRWSQRVLEATGGFGADYTFEATGSVAVMREAVEAARMGWGLCTVCGVAGRGETLDVIPRLLITGRRVCGSSFGGVKGRDQVPELVELLPARRDRRRSVHLPPHGARGGQPRVRADGGAGRHPLGARAEQLSSERLGHQAALGANLHPALGDQAS